VQRTRQRRAEHSARERCMARPVPTRGGP
jgi:hypothetical protein